MPPSIDEIFGGALDTVKNVVGDITKTGVPAVMGAIEQYGAQVLQGMATNHINESGVALSDIMNNPSKGGLGGQISNTITSIGQSTFLKNYGGMIAVGIAALLIGGYVLRGK